MLKKLRVRNFRSLRDTGELEVRRLNLLVGPNSSGKTSLFQILLALKQTVEGQPVNTPLQMEDYFEKILLQPEGLPERFSLQPRGYFANIGSYKEFVWSHEEQQKVGLEFVEDNFEFAINWGASISDEKEENIYLDHISVSFYKDEQNHISEMPSTMEKGNYRIKIDIERDGKMNIEGLKITGDLKISIGGQEARIKYDELTKNMTNIISTFILIGTIFNFTRRIFYIAPLRLEPQRVYESYGIEPKYVGKRGEQVIDALIAHRDVLEPWLKEWLEKFGMARDFKVEEIAKGTRRFQIMLHDLHIPKLAATLADVGFGISQVLPILVQAKLLPKDAIFMVEQPEIHLHPKAQAAMGDFLIDVALEGRRTLLVETHSDLVIARIANRIAEGKISHKDVMVFYFHPQKDGTKILQIEFDEDGIPTQEFPEGFLAEVSDETARHFDILSRR